jgi:vacuolar protein-sorting-associated protein 4
MLRRFERRIYIPLPDPQAREALIRGKLRDASHSLSDADIAAAARATEGYSGADLATLVRDALMQPIRELELAEEFVQVKGRDLSGQERDGLWTPSRGWTGFFATKRRCKWDEIPKTDLCRPIATSNHFKESTRRMRPSVDRSFLARYEKWTRELGECGV